ncbi:uncharacterized protein LOC113780320 [Coffea eugenioides]|uniref:uncharacterized protein LOC113780320 n=1 Tax=Coffea eugenioides TaxID=49369 RepID=UPI000F6056D0|nr:uncharacterized protein LOC113780320 [Coffea eugenioides]
MTKWQMIFFKFDIIFTTQKAIKGQAIVDHLGKNPREDDYQPLHTYFSDEKVLFIGTAEDMNEQYPEWRLFFDGASNSFGVGIGAVLVSPEGKHYPSFTKLRFFCTNNMAEYEACIFGLKIALEMEIKNLIVFSDSDLLVHQTLKEWVTQDSKILSYHCNLLDLAKKFRSLEFRHISRARNIFADALATLSSMIQHPDELVTEPIQIQLQEKLAHCLVMEKSSDGHPWYSDIKEFLKIESYPPSADTTAKSFLCKLSSKFFLNGKVVYKRTSDLGLLRCVDEDEADYLMKEVYSGGDSRNSTIYRLQMNGAVEAVNKNLKKIIRKMTEKHHDWHEKLPYALMAYRTSIRTSTGAMPYNLMYGMEAVLLAEVEIPSLCILMETKLDDTD